MITRRRSRVNTTEVQSEEVEVADEDLLTPSEEFPADETDPAGAELDDLFEDLKWTLEKDGSSPLFDIDLADFGGCDVTNQSSGVDVSAASSPERTLSDSRTKSGENRSHHVNKNAIAARLNRLKKKEYVSSLEKQADVLSAENGVLKRENSSLTKRVEELEDETRDQTTQTTTITRCPGSG